MIIKKILLTLSPEIAVGDGKGLTLPINTAGLMGGAGGDVTAVLVEEGGLLVDVLVRILNSCAAQYKKLIS